MPDMGRIAPEIFLCAMVLVVLLFDVIRGKGPSDFYPRLTLIGIFGAMALVAWQVKDDIAQGQSTVGYGGFRALQIDHLGAVFKLIFTPPVL